MSPIEPKLNRPLFTPALPEKKRQTWVQTERAAHEAWSRLTLQSPRAAALMHTLVAHMDQSTAVVASYPTLAKITGMSVMTVRRAAADLVQGQWVQVVKIGGKGTANAFVVNSRVAWASSRDTLHMAAFSARVLADAAEQEHEALEGPPLQRVPVLRAGDLQLPTGPGEEPPSQPAIDGLEPDLPSIKER